MDTQKLYALVKLSIWGKGIASADRDTFETMKNHAIAALPASSLSQMNLQPELRKEWALFVAQQVHYYAKSGYEQSNLPIAVPYVILKGTSASQYYPHPEYRTMGDIDIITRREDFDTAYQQLLDNGYRIVEELNREVSFTKNGIVIELHRLFATLNNPDKAKQLDDLIIDSITPSHVLPDVINGLVLLEHIDHHMEGGIGFRQIVDWMMFVDKCLPDDKWPEFEKLADQIGLKRLAVITTHMCEMYLGLPHREWCACADEVLCEQLMDYILYSGNFGIKKVSDAEISMNVFAYASTPKKAFRLLQKQGKINWQSAKKYRILRPFAWVYQLFRYAVKGLKRDNAVSKVKMEYSNSRKRTAMFDALGVRTKGKGVIKYIDGKYVKSIDGKYVKK